MRQKHFAVGFGIAAHHGAHQPGHSGLGGVVSPIGKARPVGGQACRVQGKQPGPEPAGTGSTLGSLVAEPERQGILHRGWRQVASREQRANLA